MNISKFTQNSVQAIEQCEKLAYEYGNQEIEQEHLLYSLLTIDDSLILKLIEKMEIHTEHFISRAKTALEKRVKVQGGQVYVGQDLNKVLIHAEDEAKAREFQISHAPTLVISNGKDAEKLAGISAIRKYIDGR